MIRNAGSQNVKPLQQSYLTFEAQEVCIASLASPKKKKKKKKHTLPVDNPSLGLFSGSAWLSLLHTASTPSVANIRHLLILILPHSFTTWPLFIPTHIDPRGA